MIIRKKFSITNMHIVRNCSSERCKKSIHAHTYQIEVFLKSSNLDEGQMVLDFGLTKGTIKEVIKSFDNSYTMWDKESDFFKDNIKENKKRWVEMPMSPSAESYSICLYYLLNKVIRNTKFANGESPVSLHKVRVHETLTGYAESIAKDLNDMGSSLSLSQFIFSDGITESWSNQNMIFQLAQFIPYENEKPTPQIEKKEVKASSLLQYDALLHYSNANVQHLMILEIGKLLTNTNYKWWKKSNIVKAHVSAILYTISDMALASMNKIDLFEIAKLHTMLNHIDVDEIGFDNDEDMLSSELIKLSKELISMIYTNDYWDIYRNSQAMLYVLGNNVIEDFNNINNDVDSANSTINSILDMQSSLNSIVNPDWIIAKQDWQSAMIAETIEAIESVDLENLENTNIDNIIVELIDIIHFDSSMLLEMNEGDSKHISSNLGSSLLLANKEGLLLPNKDYKDILADLNHINVLILKGEYAKTLIEVYKCLGRLNVTFEEIYNIYLSKNALNILRQKFGYKTGEYIKLWKTPDLTDTEFVEIELPFDSEYYEDNVVVQHLSNNVFKPTFSADDLKLFTELITNYYTLYIKE